MTWPKLVRSSKSDGPNEHLASAKKRGDRLRRSPLTKAPSKTQSLPASCRFACRPTGDLFRAWTAVKLSPARQTRKKFPIVLFSLRSFVNVATSEVKQKNFSKDSSAETRTDHAKTISKTADTARAESVVAWRGVSAVIHGFDAIHIGSRRDRPANHRKCNQQATGASSDGQQVRVRQFLRTYAAHYVAERFAALLGTPGDSFRSNTNPLSTRNAKRILRCQERVRGFQGKTRFAICIFTRSACRAPLQSTVNRATVGRTQ